MPTAPHLPPTAHTSCREDRRRSRGQAISPNFSQIGCPLDATAILSAIPRCPRAAARGGGRTDRRRRRRTGGRASVGPRDARPALRGRDRVNISVLGTGALIGLERRDPRLIALADEIVRNRLPAFVPAGVIAHAWRGSPRQHAIAKLLKSQGIRVDPLDEEAALQVGVRLSSTGSDDVVDGHVALLAARVHGVVYTSDPEDIRALDPTLQVIPLWPGPTWPPNRSRSGSRDATQFAAQPRRGHRGHGRIAGARPDVRWATLAIPSRERS